MRPPGIILPVSKFESRGSPNCLAVTKFCEAEALKCLPVTDRGIHGPEFAYR